MDILYKGKKPEDIEYVGVCAVGSIGTLMGCGTKVKFKRSEATAGPKDPQREGARQYLEVECPVCKKRIVSYYERYTEPSSFSQFE